MPVLRLGSIVHGAVGGMLYAACVCRIVIDRFSLHRRVLYGRALHCFIEIVHSMHTSYTLSRGEGLRLHTKYSILHHLMWRVLAIEYFA